MAMLCLDKICEQKEFFKDLMEDKKSFSEACKKLYLKIECKLKRSVFAQPKRKDISRNTSTRNHPPKNLSGILNKSMFPSTKRKSITVVSSVYKSKTAAGSPKN